MRRFLLFSLVASVVLVRGPSAQADFSAGFDDDDGHHASVVVSGEGTNTMTVVLTNTAEDPTKNTAHALSGVFFNVTGGGAVVGSSAFGETLWVLDEGEDTIDAAHSIANGWGFGQGLTGELGNFGVASAGLSNLGEGANFNEPMDPTLEPVMDGGLDGPPYLMVAAGEWDYEGNPLAVQSNNPWTYGTATFTFMFESPDWAAVGPAFFTWGTGPEFVSPLPGAALLGFLGLGFAGMKLRKMSA